MVIRLYAFYQKCELMKLRIVCDFGLKFRFNIKKINKLLSMINFLISYGQLPEFPCPPYVLEMILKKQYPFEKHWKEYFANVQKVLMVRDTLKKYFFYVKKLKRMLR